MEHIHIEEQVSISLEDHEIDDVVSDSESVSPSFDEFEVFKRYGMNRIEEGKNEHQVVKKSFLEGMGTFAEDTDIVAIHKTSYSGVTGRARFETFQIFSEAVAKKRGGNSNIKYAWYGSSRDEIYDILSHGFSRCGGTENRELHGHGHGIYLSPAKLSADGALSSAVDENGLRHLLLCRVILGNTEAIFPGSKQFKPTSKEFDSGVDDVLAPRRYIIWSAYMNSYILPSYVISFKAPSIGGLTFKFSNSSLDN
ncbi:hypothetical protein LguiB_016208 [Lonicera macranthoides]